MQTRSHIYLQPNICTLTDFHSSCQICPPQWLTFLMRSHKTRINSTRDQSIPRSLQRWVSTKSLISQLTFFNFILRGTTFTLLTKYMAPTEKQDKIANPKKSRHPRFEPPTLRWQGQITTCWPTVFLVHMGPYWYVPIRTHRRLLYFDQKTKTPGDGASTAETVPGRAGRGEGGEARRTNSTPNVGDLISS